MPVTRYGGLKRGPLFDTNIPATEIDKDIFTDQEVEDTIAGDDLILMLDVSETPDKIKYMTRTDFVDGLLGDFITITDNESTNENDLIPFIANAATSTGSQALEMDGDFHYNPSTGTITATTFSGALSGNATTATALASGRTIAMTGDVAWTSASFDGSGNVTGVGTIQAGAIDYSMLDNNVISSQTEITSGLAAADELLYSDGGVLKKVGLDTVATKFAGTGITASSGVINVDADQSGVTSLGTLTGLTLHGNKNVTPGDGSMIHLDTSTITDNNTSASGTAAKYTHVAIEAPTLAATNASVTTSDAATLYINAAATAGTNQTITRNWAVWVDGGSARFDGSIYSGTTEAINSSGVLQVANQSSITGLGTISSGVWAATDVAVAHGGTGASTLNNLITMGTHTTGNYVATITAGTGLTSDGATSGESITHSLSVDAAQTQITSVGTIGTGVWAATDVAVAHGGTGASTATAGFDALSPMTAEGDVLYGGSSGTVTKLAKGSDADVLTLASGVPSWATPTVGDITSVAAGVGLSGGGTVGALTITLDLSELSTVTPADGDFFSTLDSDGANEQKTTTTALATLFAGTGLTASSSVIGVDASQTQITSVGTIGTGVWAATDVAVSHGGTGASSLTDGGVLLGSGTGAITAMAVLADGEMIVGDGTTDPVAESGATLRTSIGAASPGFSVAMAIAL